MGDGAVAARRRAAAAFADVWCAIPKVVFSRSLDRVPGRRRLTGASLAEETAAALDATDKDVLIGGAGLAAATMNSGSSTSCAFPLSGRHRSRHAVLPPVPEHVPLELIDTRTFGSRVIYERYRRARDDSD